MTPEARATERLWKTVVDWLSKLPDGPLVECGFSINRLSWTTHAGQTVKIQTENCFLWAGEAQHQKKLCQSGLPYVALSRWKSLNELHAAREINATHMGAQLERKTCI